MEPVILDVQIKGDQKSVRTISEMERTVEELTAAIKEVDPASQSFKKLRRELSSARGELQEFETDLNRLDPIGRSEGFVKMGEGIAGGFAIATGAMAAFGIENENLEKLQTRAQGAIAIAIGIRAIAESGLVTIMKKSRVTKLALIALEKVHAFVLGGTTTALKALRVALVASGIGLIVIALGLLVAGWNKVSTAISKTTDEMTEFEKKQAEIEKRSKSMATNVKAETEGALSAIESMFSSTAKSFLNLIKGDFAEANAVLKTAGADMTEAYEGGIVRKKKEIAEQARRELVAIQIKETKNKIEVLEAEGKQTILMQLEVLDQQIDILDKGTEEYQEAVQARAVLVARQGRAINEMWKKVDADAQAAADKADARRKEQAEKLAKEQADRLAVQAEFSEALRVQAFTDREVQVDDLNKRLAAFRAAGVSEVELQAFKNAELIKINADYEQQKLDSAREAEAMLQGLKDELFLMSVEGETEKHLAQLELDHERRIEELRGYENFLQLKAEADAIYAAQKDKIESDARDKKEADEKISRQNQKAAARAVLGDVAGLLKEGTNAWKAAKIAEVGIDSTRGAIGAYTQAVSTYPAPYGPILGALQAGVVVAKGVQAIGKIKSTSVDGGGGSPVSGFSSGSSAAPPSTGQPGNGIDFSFLNDGDVSNVGDFEGSGSGGQGSPVTRAFVVSEDMTTEQEADQRIQELSEL